ncbi:RNA polymerase sigma factor [Paenibacillus sinopodophylli]|uniref:RNA polymerase sigma factor n=1 Tax=Paenibacillus sinopodophylli TaxID=1837342 RepID=UPI00110C9D5A|nr:sigma-70 family RNA polymerase sigma factor [Paenibacillus sinopodophylli]
MVEKASDELLIQQIAERDSAALELLYDRYERQIYAFVYRMVRDAMAAEEVVQELFIRVWNSASKLRTDEAAGKISSWLFTIARNLSVDWLRKHGRKPLEAQEEGVLEREASSHSTEQEVEHKMLGEQMKEALGELNEDQKQVVELIYFMGYTQQEVSQRHDIPLGTVKSRVRLALTQLRKKFETTWKEGVSP